MGTTIHANSITLLLLQNSLTMGSEQEQGDQEETMAMIQARNARVGTRVGGRNGLRRGLLLDVFEDRATRISDRLDGER